MLTVLRTCETTQDGLRWARVRDARDWGCARDMSQGSDRTRSQVDFSHDLWQEAVPERGFGAKENESKKHILITSIGILFMQFSSKDILINKTVKNDTKNLFIPMRLHFQVFGVWTYTITNQYDAPKCFFV